MSLTYWIKPKPAKRIHLEDSSESEDEENEQIDLDNETNYLCTGGGDASQSSVSGSSSSSKQSKRFNASWLNGRRHWLKHETVTGMFCLLCQKLRQASLQPRRLE